MDCHTLKRLLDYDPDTGVMAWRIATAQIDLGFHCNHGEVRPL